MSVEGLVRDEIRRPARSLGPFLAFRLFVSIYAALDRFEQRGLELALLRRLALTDEPLAGDLLEEYGVNRSRTWLWRQLLFAFAAGAFRTSPEGPPLGLAPAEWTPGRRVPHRDTATAMAVNITGSPVHGVGGLGLIALGVLVTAAQPEAWLFPLYGVTGGVLLGLVMVTLRRRRLLAASCGRPAGTLLNLHDVQL